MLAARRRRKRGAVVLAAELNPNPSTVGRILARHQVPHLSAIDRITGEAVRSSRRSPNRYEHRTPGAMVHVDVKKLGRIPSGGGWRLHGRDAAVSVANRHKKIKIGYDYVHTAIDDYTRLAYSEAGRSVGRAAGLPHPSAAVGDETAHGALAIAPRGSPVSAGAIP